MNEEWKTVLRSEFDAEEGSFLLQYRCGPGWDWEAYNRLFKAMLDCCKAIDGEENIPRWVAGGFHYMASLQHLSWSNYRPGDKHTPLAIENALVNFDHLAHWLFFDGSRGDDEFEPTEN